MVRSLALIHGALAHGRIWAPFLEALQPEAVPIRIELPGHGDAEEWDRDRDITDQAVELALAAMPPEPVPLIGHSYGAAVALRIAVERPYRVSSLVLIEPPFYAAVRGSYLYDKIEREMAPIWKKVEDGQSFTAAKQFLKIFGDGTPWEELPGQVKNYAVDRMAHVKAGEGLLWEDRTGVLRPGRLETLNFPVTLVEGGESPEIIPEIVDALGRRMKDAEGITIPGAGHMLLLTHPEALAEAVRDRLAWDD